MLDHPQTIAVFRLSALGDVLMFLPTVRALQRAFPHSAISWIISSPAYDIVKNIPDINFIVIEKPKSFADFKALRQKLKSFKFDVLLAAQASFRAHTIIPLISAKRKIGYDSIRGKEGHGLVVGERIDFKKVHTLEGFMQFAHHIGVSDLSVQWNLPLDPCAVDWVKQQKKVWDLKGLMVLINPAASKPERSWNAHSYAEVIDFLQTAYQAKVILCGGPSQHDKELAQEIQKRVQVFNIIGQTQLPQLLALIAAADLLICPDTGPSHMAAALGTPVIALHAVTKPEISGPYGQLDKVVNYYPKAHARYLEPQKKEKSRDWFKKVHHPQAMNLIPSRDVIEKIKAILGS
jgi:heptosyltransferase I